MLFPSCWALVYTFFLSLSLALVAWVCFIYSCTCKNKTTNEVQWNEKSNSQIVQYFFATNRLDVLHRRSDVIVFGDFLKNKQKGFYANKPKRTTKRLSHIIYYRKSNCICLLRIKNCFTQVLKDPLIGTSLIGLMGKNATWGKALCSFRDSVIICLLQTCYMEHFSVLCTAQLDCCLRKQKCRKIKNWLFVTFSAFLSMLECRKKWLIEI